MVSIQSTVGTLASFYANCDFLLGEREKQLADNTKNHSANARKANQEQTQKIAVRSGCSKMV